LLIPYTGHGDNPLSLLEQRPDPDGQAAQVVLDSRWSSAGLSYRSTPPDASRRAPTLLTRPARGVGIRRRPDQSIADAGAVELGGLDALLSHLWCAPAACSIIKVGESSGWDPDRGLTVAA
jgi:hypothetical protein